MLTLLSKRIRNNKLDEKIYEKYEQNNKPIFSRSLRTFIHN